MPIRTYYAYKNRVAQAFGDVAKERTNSDTLQFDMQILKDRFTRLYRRLEQKMSGPDVSTYDVAYASEVAMMIAANLLKLESEGLRLRQTRELGKLEDKAVRYLENSTGQQQVRDVAGVSDTNTGAGSADSRQSGTEQQSQS